MLSAVKCYVFLSYSSVRPDENVLILWFESYKSFKAWEEDYNDILLIDIDDGDNLTRIA